MEAVILAGGKGTRLRPYTITIPKPLVPVGEQPILEIILRQLKRSGFEKVTIAVNHHAELIKAYFGKGEKCGIDIAYSEEEKILHTMGPIRLIRNLPLDFFVMNGDILTNLDFRGFFNWHIQHKSKFTIATYKRRVEIDFGVIKEGEDNRVIDFTEKPVYNYTVCMGVYMLNREIVDLIPENEPFGVDELIKACLQKNITPMSYAFDGYWLDIGRPDDYARANDEFIARKFFFGDKYDQNL